MEDVLRQTKGRGSKTEGGVCIETVTIRRRGGEGEGGGGRCQSKTNYTKYVRQKRGTTVNGTKSCCSGMRGPRGGELPTKRSGLS